MRKRLENNTSEAKTGALECAGARYGFGRNKMGYCGGRRSHYQNREILDKYMDALSGE